jgi:DNA uptake protein ComE-like DNA-binding protein
MALVALGAALVAFGGCSSADRRAADRRTEKAYGEITGQRPDRQLDLNSASQKELAKLPGITDDDAARIVAHRPYGSVKALLSKKVVGQQKYEQIRDYVYVTNKRGERSYGD